MHLIPIFARRLLNSSDDWARFVISILTRKNVAMYALVEILGKQYKAEVGKTIQVDRIADKAAGDAVE